LAIFETTQTGSRKHSMFKLRVHNADTEMITVRKTWMEQVKAFSYKPTGRRWRGTKADTQRTTVSSVRRIGTPEV